MKYGFTLKSSLLALLSLGVISMTAYAEDDQGVQLANNETNQIEATNNAQVEGAAFLEKNKKKPGVVTLPDGLQYKIITAGKGARPTENDTVTVHYVGKLINGKEFDSSYSHGQPISFPVNGVIPGWTEALKLMPVGSTWELFIPANLAYGDQGAPPAIGPNETLIFKVTLLAIK